MPRKTPKPKPPAPLMIRLTAEERATLERLANGEATLADVVREGIRLLGVIEPAARERGVPITQLAAELVEMHDPDTGELLDLARDVLALVEQREGR